MRNKLIKIALIGNTNAGKSTFLNSMVGQTISIINKKINTTQNLIKGILNINETQIIFYDTPGSNFLNTKIIDQKKIKIEIWTAIEDVDCILYMIDSSKYNFKNVYSDLKKINEVKKLIIVVFNKIDLIDNKLILPYIKSLNNLKLVDSFFNISAKYKRGLDKFCGYEASGGVLLFGMAFIAILLANSPFAAAYSEFLHLPVVLKLGPVVFEEDILHFVNDVLIELAQIKEPVTRELHARSLSEMVKVSSDSIFMTLQNLLFQQQRRETMKQKVPENLVQQTTNKQMLEDDLIRLCFADDVSIRKYLFDYINTDWLNSNIIRKIYPILLVKNGQKIVGIH